MLTFIRGESTSTVPARFTSNNCPTASRSSSLGTQPPRLFLANAEGLTWLDAPAGQPRLLFSEREGQDGPKLTRASVTKTYTGDIEGEGHVEYLMMYRSDGSASFVGLERVDGRVGGKTGTFVLQRTGIFESGQAKESYSVVPGSATGNLQGLRGEGSSAVGHGMEHPFTLNYEWA